MSNTSSRPSFIIEPTIITLYESERDLVELALGVASDALEVSARQGRQLRQTGNELLDVRAREMRALLLKLEASR